MLPTTKRVARGFLLKKKKKEFKCLRERRERASVTNKCINFGQCIQFSFL